jgi:anti-sigma28 factor (negative regulator of flagellin synthesis)
MEVRNTGLNGNPDSLGSILSVSEPASTSPYGQTESAGAASESSWLEPDWATFSTLGNTVAQTAGGTGVREDKVAAVRSALAAGTYNVASSAVAGRAIDAMLSTVG